MDKIEIALASDDKYFPGLLASISSIVIGASEDYKYNFYVIDGGISENNKAFLENCLSRFKKKCSIIFLVPDLDIFKDLPKMFFGSVLPYARLLLPEMLSIDKIIYVDSDILFFNDISELWELDLQGNHAAAAKDMLINKFKYEYKDCSVFNLDPEETFFNSGIMVLDLNAFRKRSLHKETIRLRGEYPNYFKYHDQSPLNVVLYKSYLLLDQKWNFQAHKYNHYEDFELLSSMKINYHFVTSFKPWLSYNLNLPNLLFYNLMEGLGYKLDDHLYLKSKKIYSIKTKFRYFLPYFYKLRYALKNISKSESGGPISDLKTAEFWTKNNKQISFYKKKQLIINNLNEEWNKKVINQIQKYSV